MSTNKVCCVLSLLLCTAHLVAADYYVAKTGNDDNAGTEDAPFLTIGKAAAIMTAGDVCYIKAGTYREVLDPANAGTAAAPITFKAFGSDEVVISATELITEWQAIGDGIYKASVDMQLDRQNMIYVDGEPMDRARWPNNLDEDPFTIDAMTVESGTASSVRATDLPEGINLDGGYIWYLGAHSGASWTQPITSVSAENTINHAANDITKWPFNPHNPTVFRNGNRGRFFVFGARDLLDIAREWYYDADAKEVFLIAPGRVDPSNLTVEYGARTRTVLLDRAYVTVEGIKTFGGMVNVKGDYGIIRDCEIRHGYQAMDELGNTDAQVGEGSVYVQASNVLIEGNLIEGGSLNGVSVQGWGGVTDATIKGNEIREFNMVGNHSSPIRCRAFRSKLISNTLIGAGRDGIFIPAEETETAWNDVSDVMRINNDGGLFYVVGNEDNKNSSVHHNWFHDSFGPEYADGRCAGIYLDNDSKGYDVHHNVVWNISWSAIQMNWAANDNDLINNTLWNADQAMGIWLNGRVQRGNRIFNNYSENGPWEGQTVTDNIIDPTNQFRDLDERDFRPRSGSPLIDAGREVAGVTDGFLGAAPDVGAYESGAALWVPGAPRAGQATTAVPPFLAPALRARLSPNPARETVTLHYTMETAGDLAWTLLSSQGQTVRRGREQGLLPGKHQLSVSVRELPAGTYFMVGSTRQRALRKKIVVSGE